ncbi:MAG: MlaD family protein [Pseudomonadota bacterium]
MSERSASVMVGAFVVGTLVIATAAALFFAGGGLGHTRSSVVMVFDGSLRGLTVGAPIALRGVTIGQVTDIDLIVNAANAEVTMEVVGEIDQTAMRFEGQLSERMHDDLVERGLRAQLNTQSLLTGLLYVQLDFHPEAEPRLAPTLAEYPQIPTIPTELEQLRQSLQNIDYHGIAENLSRVADGLDSLLSNPDTQALPGKLRSSLASLEAAGKELSATLEEGRPALNSFLAEGRTTLATLQGTAPRISESLDETMTSFDEALDSATATLLRLEKASAPDSVPRRQLSQAMQDLSLAARALRSLARSLEEHPEALLRGRQEPES